MGWLCHGTHRRTPFRKTEKTSGRGDHNSRRSGAKGAAIHNGSFLPALTLVDSSETVTA
jgi:hypothetical protein